MSETPDGLGPRGMELWTRLNQPSPFTASGVVAVEACRAADRLDKLHAALSEGAEWLSATEDQYGNVVLVIDKALAEVRQQAAGLKALLESPVLKVSETGKASPLDDLATQRAARRAAAQGSHGA